MLAEVKARKQALRALRGKISVAAEKGAKAVNIGFLLERIAPSMAGFAYDRNDCRSLFDPIDYLIFKGLNAHGSVDSIVFAEIKTGNARLNQHQKQAKDLVERGKVAFDVYRAGGRP